MIFWITGESNVGKTTLGLKMMDRIKTDVVLLDGDTSPQEKGNNIFFVGDNPDSELHYSRVAVKAREMEKNGKIVVVALITNKFRKEIEAICNPNFIHLTKDNRDYQHKKYGDLDFRAERCR